MRKTGFYSIQFLKKVHFHCSFIVLCYYWGYFMHYRLKPPRFSLSGLDTEPVRCPQACYSLSVCQSVSVSFLVLLSFIGCCLYWRRRFGVMNFLNLLHNEGFSSVCWPFSAVSLSLSAVSWTFSEASITAVSFRQGVSSQVSHY